MKPHEFRRIFIEEKEYEATIYYRNTLSVGSVMNGPAIIEQDDTTTLILPNWAGSIDQSGELGDFKGRRLYMRTDPAKLEMMRSYF
ncbi:hypothetical protein ACEQPO_02055 [Bacillus sp. SL00103]